MVPSLILLMSKTSSRFVDFRSIKDRVSITQILEHYGLRDRFTGRDDGLRGRCPFHQGTNPTEFSIGLSKNCWNCLGQCRRGGNVLDFVARMERCSVRDAALKCIDWFELRPDPDAATTAAAPPPVVQQPVQANSPKDSPNKPLGFVLKDLDASDPYLASRGLSPETIAEFGLGLCNAGKTIFGRIAIPIHNAEGQLVAYTGRWPGDPPEGKPKYQFPKGFQKSQELFNLHRALREPPETPWIIVKGFFDVMHLWQLGIRRTAALMGLHLSGPKEALLRRHAGDQRIRLVLDETETGRCARNEIALRLARFAFVSIHAFPGEGARIRDLTAEDIAGWR